MPSIAHKSSTSRAVVGAQSTNVIVTLLCIVWSDRAVVSFPIICIVERVQFILER